MMTKKKTSCVTAAEEPSRLTAAIVEMADDQLRSGLMNDATYTRIVGRLLGAREAEQQLANGLLLLPKVRHTLA
jgi:hypothetical protein